MWYLWEASNGKFCVKCRKCTHGRCKKRVTLRMARDFVCGRRKKQTDGLMDSVKELCSKRWKR